MISKWLLKTENGILCCLLSSQKTKPIITAFFNKRKLSKSLD